MLGTKVNRSIVLILILTLSPSHTHTHTQTRTNTLGSETWNALDAFCIAPKVEDGELTHTHRHTGMENAAHTFFLQYSHM